MLGMENRASNGVRSRAEIVVSGWGMWRDDVVPIAAEGVRDEVDDHVVGEQRATAPVLRDVTEHPVLDLVPLARARREVSDCDADAGLVGKALEGHLPSSRACGIAVATIGRDHHVGGFGVA